MTQMERFIAGLPKVELHVHIEGTFEPELMLAIAARNGLPAPSPRSSRHARHTPSTTSRNSSTSTTAA